MGKQASVLTLLIFVLLLILPSKSWNYYDDASAGGAIQKNEHKDIGIGTISNQEEGAALDEFTLSAGSRINLLLWQFILWQVLFVVIGMCLCGFSVLVFNKCCKKE